MTYVDERLVLAMRCVRGCPARVSITPDGWAETRSLEARGRVLRHETTWEGLLVVDEHRARIALARVAELGEVGYAAQLAGGEMVVWWSFEDDGWQRAATHLLNELSYVEGKTHDNDHH